MIRKNTGYQCFNLTSGGNNQPNLTQGQTTSFDFSAIQISTGRMAYYLLGIVLTIYGTFTQATGSNPIPADALTAALIQSIEVRNTWMGTPISQQFALGAYLPLMEYLGCGYRLPRREQLTLPNTNGAVTFNRTIVIPMCIGMYPTPHHTAPLAAMFKTAQFVINMQAASVIAAMSSNATLTALTAQASVILAPAPSLLLAPGNYWVDYQTTAAGVQQQIQLNAFGNSPTIKGTAPNDGVLALYAIGNGTGSVLTVAGGLPGSFDPSFIANYEFPWRSQFKTTHPEAIVAAQMLAMGNGKQAQFGPYTGPTAIDSQGFPYVNDDSSPGQPVLTANTRPALKGLYGFPMVVPTEDLSLATVQTAQSTVSYFLGLQGAGTFTGNNHTLAWHLSSWSDAAVANWVSTVVNAGLAQTVLGTTNVKMAQQKIGSAKQSRFQPIALIAA
jgi:hypothetical protein